jgi:hypothetical protein
VAAAEADRALKIAKLRHKEGVAPLLDSLQVIPSYIPRLPYCASIKINYLSFCKNLTDFFYELSIRNYGKVS